MDEMKMCIRDSKEGVDAIGKTLKELELAGYIIRRQLRSKDGRISDTEYTICLLYTSRQRDQSR